MGVMEVKDFSLMAGSFGVTTHPLLLYKCKMMLCVKTFKHVHKEDFETWEDWIAFVNSNERYCKEKSTVNDYVGKCRAVDLPSAHPYWTKRIRTNVYNNMLKHIENYTLCETSPSMIGIYYNRNTQLEDIRDKINKCRALILDYDRIIRED